MKAINAKTNDDIAKLQYDNVNCYAGYSILLSEESVYLYRPGEAGYEVPREAFEDMAKWYINGDIPKSEKR